MLRAVACCAALMLGSLSSLTLSTSLANACEGAGCKAAATAKPLNLMKFMHPNAKPRHSVHTASTKAPHHRHLAAHAPRGDAPTAHHEHAVAAANVPPAIPPANNSPAAKPAALPIDAAAAFASEPAPNVQVVSSDEINDIDRAAGPAPAETEGRAVDPAASTIVAEASGPQMVENNNKSAQPAPQPAVQPPQADKPAAPSPSISWMEALWSSWSSWVWSSFSDVFGLLRDLFG